MEQDPRTLAASFLSFQELTRQVPPLKLLSVAWIGRAKANVTEKGKRKGLRYHEAHLHHNSRSARLALAIACSRLNTVKE